MHHGSLESVRSVCLDVAGKAGHDPNEVLGLMKTTTASAGKPALVDSFVQFETLLGIP